MSKPTRPYVRNKSMSKPTPCLVPKKFQDSLSHRIFGHMHETLNVVEKNNQLHSLAVNDEMNLSSLISQ